MRHFVFIIVFFLTFFKTLAFRFTGSCDGIKDSTDFKFLPNNQFSIVMYGPPKEEYPDHYPCCLQQGPMIIRNYRFFTDDPHKPFYTFWSGCEWVNGYNDDNRFDAGECLRSNDVDCSKLYEGVVDYTRVDSYDPTKFPSPGSTVSVTFDLFAYCYFEFYSDETYCDRACTLTVDMIYDPPK